MGRARATYRELTGVEAIWRQDVYTQAGERTSFGFKDGLSKPPVIPPSSVFPAFIA